MAMCAWLKSFIERLSWIQNMRLYERMRLEIDTGEVDEALETARGSVAPAAPEQYADVKPFDREAWAASNARPADKG
jgi:hypothetical protein